MSETISIDWRASTKTINALKKSGYTDEQRKRMLLVFIKRHGGQSVDNASSLYSKWVREESAHGLKYSKPLDEIKQEEKRELALKNKTNGSVQPTDRMTDEQAIEWYNQQRQAT